MRPPALRTAPARCIPYKNRNDQRSDRGAGKAEGEEQAAENKCALAAVSAAEITDAGTPPYRKHGARWPIKPPEMENEGGSSY